MNKSPLTFLLATLLLGGCYKPVDAPAASLPAGEAGNETVSAPGSVPTAATDAPAATNDSGVAPAPDDHTAVNASIDRVLGDHARYQAVIEAYQKGVRDGDRVAVAALVNYPITVRIDGSKTAIKGPAAFVLDYDRILTPDIASTIESQRYSDLMVNSRGVMFGSGESWINGICTEGSADCSEFEVKVVTIQAGGSN